MSPTNSEVEHGKLESCFVDPLHDVNSREYKAMSRKILFKLDLYTLPPLALLWLANFLDRANVGNARIAGLEKDIHLHGNQFNAALAVFFATYIVAELPSNWIVKRVKPDRWLPIIVCCWGLVTTLCGLVQSYGGLIAIRLMLGLCEGGLLPGIVLYLSTMYRRHEFQLRVGVFYASASLSGAFGGLLASAILNMDGLGGLAGWRWIFIIEGIGTVLCGVIASIFMPASLAEARFLTEEEKRFAIERFYTGTGESATRGNFRMHRADSKERVEQVEDVSEPADAIKIDHDAHGEVFEWREVRRGLLDPQVWMTGLSYLGLIMSLYSYSLFLPTIVAGLGYSGSSAQLHTVPPYVPAAVLTVVVAILADRLKWRGPFILMLLPMTIIGYIVAITAKTNTGRYAAVFLMAAGVYPSGPCILSILPNNSAGHYKKATTTAMQLMIANAGGPISVFVYTSDQAPRYIRGHSIVLAFVIMSWLFMAANVSYCIWENKARREGRRQKNVEDYQRLWDEGQTRAPIGDRSPDFRFTL